MILVSKNHYTLLKVHVYCCWDKMRNLHRIGSSEGTAATCEKVASLNFGSRVRLVCMLAIHYCATTTDNVGLARD